MADQSENAPEAPETPVEPITIREQLEYSLNELSREQRFETVFGRLTAAVEIMSASTALQGLVSLRIAESLERLETYLRPPNTGPWANAASVRDFKEHSRCLACKGTGRLESETNPYCPCRLGQDLARMERKGSTNAGA